MEAPQTLRRPANWQDFKNLCKKLWGEIWNCPEIKKNGRNGQAQQGVDVYGIPFGEDQYYGIQCKGKDEYTDSQFTDKEIIAEIEKAKLFQPPLKKLYFATTAVKDAKIEQFVRTKNIQKIKDGLFEVHLFSWEDIVDLIDENKHTHDWYVKSQNFKTTKSVSVTWPGGAIEFTITPKFKTEITHYRLSPEATNPYVNTMADLAKHFGKGHTFSSPLTMTEVNLSYSRLYLQIYNTGADPIENYKVLFQFEGEISDLTDTNEKDYGLALIRAASSAPDVFVSNETMSGTVVPHIKILVGDDTFNSDDFFIKPLPKDYEITLKWKLISKDFKDEGALKLLIRPGIAKNREIIYVEDLKDVRIEGGEEFDDVIVQKTKE
jgi:hypothetical protein